MEITTMQMYWLVMLDNIFTGSVVMCTLVTILLLCLIFGAADAADCGECPIIIKILIPIVFILFISLFSVCIFLPNTKQMVAIMIVPKIANSEKVHTIGNRVYDIAVEWMEEMKPNKK